MAEPLPARLRLVQVCLLVIAAIAIFGGSLQMYLGEPQSGPRLDNIHRFMAGIYLSTGFLSLWAGLTIRRQGALVLFIALGAFLGGVGRLVSIALVGLPEPHWMWLSYLVPELLFPIVITAAWLTGRTLQ